jgi:hypothetical protein
MRFGGDPQRRAVYVDPKLVTPTKRFPRTFLFEERVVVRSDSHQVRQAFFQHTCGQAVPSSVACVAVLIASWSSLDLHSNDTRYPENTNIQTMAVDSYEHQNLSGQKPGCCPEIRETQVKSIFVTDVLRTCACDSGDITRQAGNQKIDSRQRAKYTE